MTQQEFGKIREYLDDKHYLNSDKLSTVTIWSLLLEFMNDVAPIFVNPKTYTYEPIKKWQIVKLYRLAAAVYKFLSSLKKLKK